VEGLSNFHINSIESDIQTSQRDAIQNHEDLIIELELIEIQIRQIKSLIINDDYYTSIIDEIVFVKTELDNIAYFLLVENVKNCIAETLQSGDPNTLDMLLITIGRGIKS